MKFQRFALNAPDARAAARSSFHSDDTGRVIFKVYSSPGTAHPDYSASHPLSFHVAFLPDDPLALRATRVAAGGRPAYEETVPDGSLQVRLRDPWEIPIQLVHRVTPFPAF